MSVFQSVTLYYDFASKKAKTAKNILEKKALAANIPAVLIATLCEKEKIG